MSKLDKYKVNYTLETIPEDIDEKDKIIFELIHEMANDNNSSKFREEITLNICNYENSPGKLGEDGIDPVTNRKIEVKPQNGHNRNDTIKKLNGGGQFTDFTHSRIQKCIDNDILMVVSGFYNGKLKFIVQFDFNSPTFLNHIKNKVCKALPEGDQKSKYCRTADFGWNKWKDANNLKLMYISPNIDNSMISGPLLKLLNGLKIIP
jgi:hypothetical protein